MPRCVRLWSAFAQFSRDPGSKMIDPSSDGFIGHGDPALSQEIFDVAKAQREADIQPDGLLNDHRRKAIAAIADFGHRGE